MFQRDPSLVLRPADKAAHLRAFLQQHTDGRPVVLVGASLGGAKALDFAHTYPEVGRALDWSKGALPSHAWEQLHLTYGCGHSHGYPGVPEGPGPPDRDTRVDPGVMRRG